MLLCIDRGAVSADDTEPLLRECIERELTDDRRELRDGVCGSGFSSSLPNSLNSLSRPGCIWRAIIGKWLRRSLKDLTSFLRGMDELRPPAELDAAACVAATSFLTAIVAGMIGVASHVPMSGFDMKYMSHGCASNVSG
jgi:hypothetical protein